MKKRVSLLRATWLLLSILPLTATAENVYIDDKVMVGLHQDKDIDSAIIKLIPGGTSLEVLKRDSAFTQVKEPGGTSGWIDNHYLVDSPPGRAQTLQLQEKITRLEGELSVLKTGRPAPPAAGTDNQDVAALDKENGELKQQLQSAQLKVGEFQAQVAELRNQLSQLTSAPDVGDKQVAAEAITVNADSNQPGWPGLPVANLGWRVIATGIVACLLIGLVSGILLMDWNNRRRHGGFRI
jgi:SH3 domain protein